MLNITYTNTTLQGYKSLYRQLKKQPSTKHIFIVPDRFTLGVEKEICDFCSTNGSFDINVYSITRLATKSLGKRLNKCLSKEGTVVLLNRVIKENNDQLIYYKSIKSYQFSKEMFAAIASLRNSNISVEQIKMAVPLFYGATKEKLSDIALIYEKYLQALKERFVDTITRVDALIDNIKLLQPITSSHIYFLGFNIYSSQQLRLIKELLLYCPSVSLAVTSDSYGTNKANFPSRQVEEIIDFCNDKGIGVAQEESFAVLKEPFNHLHRNLFGFKQEVLPSKNDEIIVFCEDNPYEEVKAVAKEISYLVKNQGYRYKDISLVCNNAEYLPIVSEIFARCDVPCFIEKKYFVKDSVLLKYIFALYNCVCGNYAMTDILKLLHHPFANIDSEDSIILENYIKKYNIEYSIFLKPFVLGDFVKAEQVRQKLISQLALVPKSDATVAMHCDFINTLIQREDIAKVLAQHLLSLEEKLVAGSKTETFVMLLEEITQLIGQESIELFDFVALLQSATHDMSVSLLPRYIDVVFVGNTTQSRFSEQKVIFVVGGNRGYFPLQKGDNIIFTAMDAEIMKTNGLSIFPSPFDYNGFEQFVVIDLMTKADTIYLGYSLFGMMGEELNKGEGIREIEYLLQLSAAPLISYKKFDEKQALLYNIVNLKNAYYEYMYHKIPIEYRQATCQFLTQNGYNLDSSSNTEQSLTLENIFKRDDKGRYLTSVSQLESYFSCPFKHFLSYGLKLKEDDNGELNPSTIGIFIHNVLEIYFKENHKVLKTTMDYKPLIEAAIAREMHNPDYYGLMNNTMNAHAFKNITSECRRVLTVLTENYRNSLFEAKYFEFGFGYDDNNLITVNVEDKIFSLRGKIDRVDFYKNNVVIIDYKTGKAERAFREIYYGGKIQLYVYLNYFLKNGFDAGGVFYLPIKSGYTKDGKFYTLIGHMLNDLEIYYAMDGKAKSFDDLKYDSKVLPYTLSNKGGEVGIKKLSGVMDKKDFDAVVDYVFRLIKENLKALIAGDISKSPLNDECERCRYKNICGQVPMREFSPKEIADFFILEEQC